jgi:hypothetical protein
MPLIEVVTDQRAVTLAGTPEQIYEGIPLEVVVINIRAEADNTGNIYITTNTNRDSASSEGDILQPGENIEYDVRELGFDAFLDLSQIWIDADTSGDGVSYSAFKRV